MKLKLIQPDLIPPAQPHQITTDTSEAFFEVCDRHNTGELVIEAVSRGNGNGQWICDVWWP